jgi:hypothetical protein
MERLGFSKDFTGSDKVITYVTVGWPLVWTLIFIAVTAYNLFVRDLSTEAWTAYWHGWTWFILVCAIIVTAWFTIGGFVDLRNLFRDLRARTVDVRDDGRVEQTDS